MENITNNIVSDISINSRKRISLSGIKKLISFNPNEFLIDSSLGIIVLKGNNLEVLKLDVVQGELNIKGSFDSLEYVDKLKKKESIIARLFK